MLVGDRRTGIVGGVARSSSTPTAATRPGNSGAVVLDLRLAIVDNIPYTATAIPVVDELILSGLPAEPLWWSLALGACLGGNLTIVGASANVVVANLAKRAGYPIRFFDFLKYGSVVVAESLIISTLYLWVRYLR
jgi:Na+/H+ antiporter NhaD/arsenite permease-like protein